MIALNMYYSFPCSYCGKVFYTFSRSRSTAADELYSGIKTHLRSYDEDHKEYQFDEAPVIEVRQMYTSMIETSDPPKGAYELR
jgi:hypothetical protein